MSCGTWDTAARVSNRRLEPWQPRDSRGCLHCLHSSIVPPQGPPGHPLPITLHVMLGLHWGSPREEAGVQQNGVPNLVLLLCLQQECSWCHGSDFEDFLAGFCRKGVKK